MKSLENKRSAFFNDLLQIIAIQIVFQLLFSLWIEYSIIGNDVEIFQYIQISSYFLIFLIASFSLKYAIANKILIVLFMFEFFCLAINPMTYFFNQSYYNFNVIASTMPMLLTSIYLFFFSISPKHHKSIKHFFYSIIITSCVLILTYYDVNYFIDYSTLGDQYLKTINELFLSTYSVFLINLSVLIFIWIIYSQGQFILSEYLPSITAIHTLAILNEVYQLYNVTHLIDNFIDSMVFNFIINSGFIIVWLIRLNYISKPETVKKEKYILNYDLLKGYVDRHNDGLWNSLLIKMGKKNLFVGSLTLFTFIVIPLIFLGDIDIFNRVNIILLIFFILVMMIYAIIYTQKRWFDHIGFLFKNPKK